MALFSDGISLMDKALFTAFLIVLVVIVAILLNHHYYGTIRSGMLPTDFILYATPDTELDQSLYEDCIEFEGQLGSMVNETFNEKAICEKELDKSKRNTTIANTT